MTWCEANRVDYVFGLARNARLAERSQAEFARQARGGAVRQGRRAASRTSATRRWTVGAGSAALSAKPSTGGQRRRAQRQPSLHRDLAAGEIHGRRALYEKLYCARGEMENRIKECQLDLFADRTSAGTMRANQLRLWFAVDGLCAARALRRIGLATTRFAHATSGTIRLKLLKLGALVRVSVRRVTVADRLRPPLAAGLGHRPCQALTAAAG